MQFFGFREKATIGLCFEHTNCDQVSAGLEYARSQEIDARILDPRAATDKGSVHIYRVHALDRSEEHQATSRRERIRQHNLSAEPGHGRRIRHAEFGKTARDGDFLPGRIVEVWVEPLAPEPEIVLVVPVHDVVAIFGSACS